MIFTQPNTAYKQIEVKDAYGTITSSEDKEFCCFIEVRTQVGFSDGKLLEVGKGIVYTTENSLAFDTGDKLKINSEEYIVKACHKATGIDGEFSHWELTYG